MTITLITGVNSGLGFATAKKLLEEGHAIIGTVRDQAKSQVELSALQSIESGELTVFDMDLASLQSVQDCAEKMINAYETIDILIFNAGIMTPPHSITENGFESQFQVNYLSHYYLFSLLEKRLLKSETKKVISISSLSSEKGINDTIASFEKDARCSENDYDAMKSYRESKLAQVLFTAELNNRFSKDGLRSYAVHPGIVNTNLFTKEYSAFAKALIQPMIWLGYATGFLKTADKGAETAIYLATNDIQQSGLYWADKKVRQHNPITDNQRFLKEFWEWSQTSIEEALPDKN